MVSSHHDCEVCCTPDHKIAASEQSVLAIHGHHLCKAFTNQIRRKHQCVLSLDTKVIGNIQPSNYMWKRMKFR